MDLTDIKEQIAEVITNIIGGDENEITGETNLITDLACDSLNLLEIIMAVEKEFSVSIHDSDWNDGGVETVGKIAAIVQSKLKVDA